MPHKMNWQEFPPAMDKGQDAACTYDDIYGHYEESKGGKPTESAPPASQMPNTPEPFGKTIAGK